MVGLKKVYLVFFYTFRVFFDQLPTKTLIRHIGAFGSISLKLLVSEVGTRCGSYKEGGAADAKGSWKELLLLGFKDKPGQIENMAANRGMNETDRSSSIEDGG